MRKWSTAPSVHTLMRFTFLFRGLIAYSSAVRSAAFQSETPALTSVW